MWLPKGLIGWCHVTTRRTYLLALGSLMERVPTSLYPRVLPDVRDSKWLPMILRDWGHMPRVVPDPGVSCRATGDRALASL